MSMLQGGGFKQAAAAAAGDADALLAVRMTQFCSWPPGSFQCSRFRRQVRSLRQGGRVLQPLVLKLLGAGASCCCRNVVHRDLKLENLLLASPDEITKVCGVLG